MVENHIQRTLQLYLGEPIAVHSVGSRKTIRVFSGILWDVTSTGYVVRGNNQLAEDGLKPQGPPTPYNEWFSFWNLIHGMEQLSGACAESINALLHTPGSSPVHPVLVFPSMVEP